SAGPYAQNAVLWGFEHADRRQRRRRAILLRRGVIANARRDAGHGFDAGVIRRLGEGGRARQRREDRGNVAKNSHGAPPWTTARPPRAADVSVSRGFAPFATER